MRSIQIARYGITILIATALAATNPTSLSAQGIGGALKKRAEEAKKRLEDEAAKKAAADSAKKKADSTKTGTAAPSAAPTTASSGASAGTAAPAKADPKIWENYDFIPGNKVLFYTDFSEDRVGNFARGLKFVSGTMDVIERDGVKMLRATAPSHLLIPVGRKLPERFTLEIDVISPPQGTAGFDLVAVEGGTERDGGAKSAILQWNVHAAIDGGGQDQRSAVYLSEEQAAKYHGRVSHIRVLMDSGYFKMYANERRLYNIPQLPFKRDSVIRMYLRGSDEQDHAVFLTGVRVAESETDVMYDALAAKGRWATHGILFATGKADLQPESRAVLKEIAATLKQHADLKVLIEGHTDNVGAAASNLTLSEARAAAVKAALVADFGVDGSRISTKGFGDTKPAAPNTNAAGRAQNRRVEIVKQ